VDSKALDAAPEFEVATVKPSQSGRLLRAHLGRNAAIQTKTTPICAAAAVGLRLNEKQVVAAGVDG